MSPNTQTEPILIINLENSHALMFKILLLSTYELGHQPFGLASPAAWLRQKGFEVTALDLAIESLSEASVGQADFIAFYLPMHTATRLTIPALARVRKINPQAVLCCYGLYAPLNESYLRSLGVSIILGGEFEESLVQTCLHLQEESSPKSFRQQTPPVTLPRQKFFLPDRKGLPDLSHYAQMHFAEGNPRLVGYVEASRGCKHTCRHCPIVPVYEGKFRVVQQAVVLADIRQQVKAGAEHITFGDPDFFNGIGHALPIVQAMNAEFPQLTFDVTLKVEHLLRHAEALPILKQSGCVMVTSAAESVDDEVLLFLQKNHTAADLPKVIQLLDEAGLAFNPTWIPFTPWTTREGFREFLQALHIWGLVERMAPIQWTIRLLLTNGSKLLELPQIQEMVGRFNPESLAYEWAYADAKMEDFYEEVVDLVKWGLQAQTSRWGIFKNLWECVNTHLALSPALPPAILASRAAFPYLNEPWYC